MGCGLTKAIPLNFVEPLKRRDTAPMSVDDLKKSLLDEYTHIQKRFGHPQYYKQDGYALGMRIDGCERYQSYYIGASRVVKDGKVAIKEHHLNTCKEQDIIREVLILAKLQHPCLPVLHELFVTSESVFTVSSPVDATRLSYIADCRPGSKNSLSLNDTRVIIRQVIEAVNFCHSKNIIVRNLAPKNICVKRLENVEGSASSCFEVKIADFSLAVMNGSHDYLCDSPYFSWSQVPFMAPEALLGNPYSFPMDMWAIGVLLFMMVTNKLPFDNEDDVELMNQITHSNFNYPNKQMLEHPVPAPLRYLISQLLFVDEGLRLSNKEALSNAWINSPALPEECVIWSSQ